MARRAPCRYVCRRFGIGFRDWLFGKKGAAPPRPYRVLAVDLSDTSAELIYAMLDSADELRRVRLLDEALTTANREAFDAVYVGPRVAMPVRRIKEELMHGASSGCKVEVVPDLDDIDLPYDGPSPTAFATAFAPRPRRRR